MKLKFIFNYENDSPAPHPGQRERSQLHVITVTGENRALGGRSREASRRKQESEVQQGDLARVTGGRPAVEDGLRPYSRHDGFAQQG